MPAIKAILLALAIAGAVVLSYYMAAPAIDQLATRWKYLEGQNAERTAEASDLKKYIHNGGRLKFQGVSYLTPLYVNADVDDPNVIQVAETYSVGGGTWLPSSLGISDSYGSLLATMLADFGRSTAFDDTTKQMLRAYAKRPNSLNNQIALPLLKKMRADADRFGAGSPDIQGLRSDFEAFLLRDESQDVHIGLGAEYRAWRAAAAGGPVEEIDGTLSLVGNNRVEGKPLHARLWGLDRKVFQLQRPKWFKEQYIIQARHRVLNRRDYDDFFGSPGLLAFLPVGVELSRVRELRLLVEPGNIADVSAWLSHPEGLLLFKSREQTLFVAPTAASLYGQTMVVHVPQAISEPRITGLILREE